jgi:hypothetical protein
MMLLASRRQPVDSISKRCKRSVGDAPEFFPVYDPETAVKTWAIYRGTPYYLQTIDPNKPLAENVSQSILSEQRLLHTEPEFLLRTEL